MRDPLERVDRGAVGRAGTPRCERRRAVAVTTLALSIALLLAACGGPTSRVGEDAVPSDWAAVQAAARGQTVRWWLYGGDQRINVYIDRQVVPAAARLGVTLKRVPVADTADAVQRVLADRRAGRTTGGAVDLIWINGENFAAGKMAGLWLQDWAARLPNIRYVNLDDPAIARDLGVPIDAQEAPWSRAAFVFAADRATTPQPPTTFPELLAYAKAHPGRITYPAPPDFTGSAFVRQVLQRLGSRQAGFAFLQALKPYQWRGGRTFPKSEAELNQLFADGQVDLAMSYDPSFVAGAVAKGQFPPSTRPFLLGGGALVNTSYVTIPANAANLQGAMVVANLLLDPRLQAIKADPDVVGVPTVLDPGRLPQAARRLFTTATDSPYLLSSFGRPLQELPADQVAPIEQRWLEEILR
ncbi:MAG TPA: ABC transporter substrate-binding protein [Actinomycetes bacterium]|nr:ABC transporter substrate-binding protein [Actinomycetes bacterium]